MEKARLYQQGTVGEKVFAHEIDDEPWWRRQKIPLICAFCMTPVVSQRTAVGRAPRAALFRLARDRQHEDVCPLNPTEVLQKIAHGSQGVAVVEGDELHLVLPDDLGQIGSTTPVIDTGPAAPGERFGVDISTVRPLLPPLINSAVVIARFLQKHDYDADVVAQFKVRRPGGTQAVGWGEFCHGPASGDHARLYARLSGGPKPEHPVAVYGRVTAVEHDSQDRPVLRLADGRGFTVRIRSEHASLLNPLAAAPSSWPSAPGRSGHPAGAGPSCRCSPKNTGSSPTGPTTLPPAEEARPPARRRFPSPGAPSARHASPHPDVLSASPPAASQRVAHTRCAATERYTAGPADDCGAGGRGRPRPTGVPARPGRTVCGIR